MQGFCSRNDLLNRRNWLIVCVADPNIDVIERLFMIQERINIEKALGIYVEPIDD